MAATCWWYLVGLFCVGRCTDIDVSSINVQSSLIDGNRVNGSIVQGSNQTLYYSYFSNDCDRLTLTTCNPQTQFDTELFVYNSSGHLVTFNDDDNTYCRIQSRIVMRGVPLNATFIIGVSGYQSDYGDFSLETFCQPFDLDASRSTPVFQNSTNRTNSTEHYIVPSNPVKLSQTFRYSTIQCSVGSICNVVCDTELACYFTLINASLADTLSLTCSDFKSCAAITIIAAQRVTNIDCVRGCRHSELQTAKTDAALSASITIKCTGHSACYYANFFVSSVDELSLSCMQRRSCYRTYLKTTDVAYSVVECSVDGPCLRLHVDFIRNEHAVMLLKDEYSGTFSEITVNDTALSMGCTGRGSCYGAEITVIGTGSVDFDCQYSGSCANATLSCLSTAGTVYNESVFCDSSQRWTRTCYNNWCCNRFDIEGTCLQTIDADSNDADEDTDGGEFLGIGEGAGTGLGCLICACCICCVLKNGSGSDTDNTHTSRSNTGKTGTVVVAYVHE